MQQKKIVTDVLPLPDYTVTLDALNERVTSADTLSVDAAGNYSISNTHSSTSYAENQLGLGCQSRILTSAGLKLTGEADGVNCP